MAGSAVAHRLARRVLRSPNLTETIRHYRQLDGMRGTESGEWEAGEFVRTDIIGVCTPTTGEQRLLLPENLREIESRRFIVSQTTVALGTLSEGDVLVWDQRAYRAQMVRDWGGFWEIIAVLPTDADLDDVLVLTGAYSTAFGAGFDRLAAA